MIKKANKSYIIKSIISISLSIVILCSAYCVSVFKANATTTNNIYSKSIVATNESQLVTVPYGYDWARVDYFDNTTVLKANTTYKAVINYKCFSGNMTFMISYTHEPLNDISKIAESYKVTENKEKYYREIEFTMGNASNTGFRFLIGELEGQKDFNASFAYPRFYEVDSNGDIVGENLVMDFTADTLNDAKAQGNTNKNMYWNFRYAATKNPVTYQDVPENYFGDLDDEDENESEKPQKATQKGTIHINNSNGSLIQFATAESSQNYALSLDVKNNTSTKPAISIKGITANGEEDITLNNIKTDLNGSYNYYCEFNTPSELIASKNIKIIISFTNSVDSYISNIIIYKTSGSGSNILSEIDSSNGLAQYDDTPQNIWMIDGSDVSNISVSGYDDSVFNIGVTNVFIFSSATKKTSGGCTVGHNVSLTKSQTYNFSIYLKYANSGYSDETGITFEYLNTSSQWTTMSVSLKESTNEYKLSGTFTMPSAASSSSNNFRFRVLFGSQYVSGYIANAVITKTGSTTNLVSNGDFSQQTSNWEITGTAGKSLVSECPKDYFLKSFNDGYMVTYHSTGSWVRFYQDVTLKQNTYYKVVCEQVNPWGQNTKDGLDCEVAIQTFGYNGKTRDTAFNMYISSVKSATGKTFTALENQQVEKNYTKDAITTVKFLYTDSAVKTLDDTDNARITLYMEGQKSAGIWGSIAIYECDANGNVLSNNIMLNGDFNFGMFAWEKVGEFSYRRVKKPDNFFKNYKTYDNYMVVSKGSESEALLYQNVEAKKNETYYLSAYYLGINSAGIIPRITYTNTSEEEVEISYTDFYDGNRFFYEAEFTVPDDAKAVDDKVTINVGFTNGNNGIGYLSTIRLYEGDGYESLFENTEFINNFDCWQTSGNYTLSSYDSSKYRYYYNDSEFDDGNWSEKFTKTKCGDNLDYNFDSDTKTLTINGTGAMYDFENPDEKQSGLSPWYDYHEDVKNVIIGGGVTSIGEYAFCNYTGIINVKLSSSITLIGTSAFMNCTSLKNITIPKNCEYIGNYAFNNCISLLKIKTGGAVEIGEYAFANCESLTKVEINDNLKAIYGYAFTATGITDIYIPETVEYMSNNAFDGIDPVIFCDDDSYAKSYAINKGISYQIK